MLKGVFKLFEKKNQDFEVFQAPVATMAMAAH
jgi:hypothetical protein